MPSNCQPIPPATRDLNIDGIRGYLLIIMSVNHLCPILFGNFEAFPCNLCFNTFGIFTTYQGFLFISGMMCAQIYGRLIVNRPQIVWERIFQRIRLLYIAQMVVLGSLYIAANWNSASFLNHPGLAPLVLTPLRTLGRGLFLMFTPASLDILPLYIFFLVLFPFIFRAIRRGWSAPVLATSLSIWALGQKLNLPRASFFSGFDPLSYQLLFVCGVWIGSRGLAGPWPTWYSRNSRHITGLCIIICAFFFMIRRGWLGYELPTSLVGFSWTNQRFLHPSILINFLASCQIVSVVLIYAKTNKPITNLIKAPATLGRYSLLVFVLNESIWNFLTATRESVTGGFYTRIILLLVLVLSPLALTSL